MVIQTVHQKIVCEKNWNIRFVCMESGGMNVWMHQHHHHRHHQCGYGAFCLHGALVIVTFIRFLISRVYDKSNNRGKYFLACILSFTKCCVRSDCSLYEFCIRQMCIKWVCMYMQTQPCTHTTTAFIFRNIFDCHPDATAIRYDTIRWW